MWAVQTPESLDRDQLGDHLVVGQAAELVELQRAVEHVLGQRAQEADLGAGEAGGGAQLLGIVGQHLLRGRRAAAEALGQPPVDRRAALVESCWPTIERTSAP